MSELTSNFERIARKPAAVLALLLFATGVMLHANLGAPFFFMDDLRYLRHVAKRSWTEQLRPAVGFHYVPVTYLSLKADMLVAGVNSEYFLLATEHNVLDMAEPTPSTQSGNAAERKAIQELTENAVKWAWFPRLMNGIYHTLAGFLLWVFLTRIRAGAGVALFIAFVWTAHPAALESVAWVCERKNVKCALWSFAALLAWTLSRENRWRWPLVTLAFMIAIFSKVSAFSIVPVLCALEFFDPLYRSFDWRSRTSWLKSALRLSGVMVVAVVGVFSAVYFFKGEIVRPPGGSSWTGLLTDSDIFARYTLNTLWPFGLSFFYGVEPILSLGELRFWKYFLPLAAFWLALFHFTRREERFWTAFGFVWFFGALGPNANIVASAFPMQDRYTYLPMPGLLIALAFAAKGFFEVVGATRWLPVAGVVYAGFILSLCGLRSGLFADNQRLIENAAALEPKSRLANAVMVISRVAEFKKALPDGIQPDASRAQHLAQAILLYATRAENCPDESPFLTDSRLRLERFNALKFLGREEEALDVLKPVLKPAGAFAVSPDARKSEGFQARMIRVLDLLATAEAWRFSGETLLRFASNPKYTPAQQMEFARQAVECAAQVLEFFPPGQVKYDAEIARGQLLRGKGLLRLSELSAAAGAKSDAERYRAEGMLVLQNIDKRFGAGEEAGKIVKELRPLQH